MTTVVNWEAMGMKRLHEIQGRLLTITKGCRMDMHEPDEQGLAGVGYGDVLDNAMGDKPGDNGNELTIGLVRNGKTEWFNVADLIALARFAALPFSGRL